MALLTLLRIAIDKKHSNMRDAKHVSVLLNKIILIWLNSLFILSQTHWLTIISIQCNKNSFFTLQRSCYCVWLRHSLFPFYFSTKNLYYIKCVFEISKLSDNKIFNKNSLYFLYYFYRIRRTFGCNKYYSLFTTACYAL